MYDTVRFGFLSSPTMKQLENWHYSYCRSPKGHYMETYWTMIDTGRTSIKVVYYPQDPIGRPRSLLLIEASLPKILYGNNIKMLADYHEAIDGMEKWMSISNDIPRLDLRDGNLYRLDLCYNLQVGEYVYDWISALFNLSYPNRRNKPYYPTDGVVFYSKHAILSFYAKEEECGNSDAHGILRMEASWNDKELIGGLVGKKIASINDFPAEVVKSLLENELEKIGILNNTPIDDLATSRVLIGKYGVETGTRLFGFLAISQGMHHRQLVNLGYSKSSISQNEKAIKDAGLCMSLTEQGIMLPKLRFEPISLYHIN